MADLNFSILDEVDVSTRIAIISYVNCFFLILAD